jgi:hypothetical protein
MAAPAGGCRAGLPAGDGDLLAEHIATWTASSARRRAVLAILLLPIREHRYRGGAAYALTRERRDPALQGRYLPGVVALAAIVAIGLHRALGRNGSWLPLLTLGAAVASRAPPSPASWVVLGPEGASS